MISYVITLLLMVRRTDSQGDMIHFFKIKDLYYFQELLRDYDLSVVRQFLQNNIEIVQLLPWVPYQMEADYRYIPGQNGTVFRGPEEQLWELKQGYAIQDTNEFIVSRQMLVIYRISGKIETTLKVLYNLQIPLFSSLKCSQKLLLYGKCDIIQLDYGSYVYRKGDPANAIYYLLQGQVKIAKKRKEEFVEIANIEKGRMFGVYCLKLGKQNRDLMARSSQNGTRVLVIPRCIIDILCKEKDISAEKLLESVNSELKSLVKVRGRKRCRADIENELNQNSKTLERRIKCFEQERQLKNNLLETLAQTKTLFVRVKNLNTTCRNNQKAEDVGILKNASDLLPNRHKFSFKKLQKRTTETGLTSRESDKKSNFPIRNFVGLTRYPSVQRYLHRLSRQGEAEQ